MAKSFCYIDWVDAAKDFISTRLRAKIAGFAAQINIEPPLTAKELPHFRGRVRMKPPQRIEDFLSTGSRACRFRYTWDLSAIPKELVQAAGLGTNRIYGGVDLCVAKSFVKWTTDCKAWATDTWIAEDDEAREMWLESFPFAALRNGDYLGLRLGKEPEPQVVYLSHDDVSMVIAPSFAAFLTTWARLCYLGPEIWMLDGFRESETGFLTADSEQAQGLRDIFQFHVTD
ncbi:MAG TPA: SMI1/KNR4 family protein [Candidatus Acidoferrum sp.]|nr:SMI1/KNR4 family protein [Candidatus Acidoferrum sp.]